MNTYKKTIDISYNDIGSRFMLTKTKLAEILQQMAIEHSDTLGYNTEFLLEQNRGWIITNWHIVMDRIPVKGEKIEFTTWSEGMKRLMATRGFTAEDEQGNIIMRAASRWMFMDLEERKPVSVPKEMEEKYYSGLGYAIEDEKYRLPKNEKEEPDCVMDVTVTRSKTDSNAHTNNVEYITWAMDSVPDEIYDNLDGYDVKVVYRKESYRGDKLRVMTYVEDAGEEKLVNTFIVSAEDESVVHAQISTLWR